MKDEFKGFYSLQQEQLKTLWNNAVIIFDANVLLNLYRYQQSTTEQMLQLIERLKDRVWIPYHVGLEYQRNRPKVIASQNTKFSEVEDIISKGTSAIRSNLEKLQLQKRHSTIDPEPFLEAMNSATEAFVSELNKLKADHLSVVGEDVIRNRLDELLRDRVGAKPDSQKAIDELENKAEVRFKNKVPPGYMDDEKEQSDEPVFSYANLTYRRKYSDYIVWSQIVEYAQSSKVSDLVFITDDNKEDWWLKVKQNGVKTISPRPELIGEITEIAKVQRFHMYSSEGFIKYTNELLQAGVSDEAIEEVREVASVTRKTAFDSNYIRTTKMAMRRWLSAYCGDNYELVYDKGPTFAIWEHEGRITAFYLNIVHNFRVEQFSHLKRFMLLGHHHAAHYGADEIVCVFVMPDAPVASIVRALLISNKDEFPLTTVMTGIAERLEGSSEVSGFNLIGTFEIGQGQEEVPAE
ncbi:PIN domain-containing protein [Pseudoalteromonas sp. OANN1]|uniref:PIN domain-containing protein n=1 Tax=Pseudoalteromonas sp. OANN1 TaxID=2954497 RepID=UPI0020973717|nr:PIN domain-containing protein [Pseudoalteromonas sp. OANN1]MCO7199502.1 PIN domain-containing protein [Pseudoalteromonas sp. OANN1]